MSVMADDGKRRPMIELNNIHKEYDLGQVKVKALNGADICIEEGDFTVIAGPSGSGKTTLLNIIGLLDAKSDGTYELDGQRIEEEDFDQLAGVRNKKIGFIFQNFNLFPVLNVRENVEFPIMINGSVSREQSAYVDQLIHDVGLETYVHHRPDELSGGQQQRVAIARALATQPKIVLADEPTANLDTDTAHSIIDLMIKLNRERRVTFIFSTHDQRLILRARKIIHLEDGAIKDEVVAPPPQKDGQVHDD